MARRDIGTVARPQVAPRVGGGRARRRTEQRGLISRGNEGRDKLTALRLRDELDTKRPVAGRLGDPLTQLRIETERNVFEDTVAGVVSHPSTPKRGASTSSRPSRHLDDRLGERAARKLDCHASRSSAEPSSSRVVSKYTARRRGGSCPCSRRTKSVHLECHRVAVESQARPAIPISAGKKELLAGSAVTAGRANGGVHRVRTGGPPPMWRRSRLAKRNVLDRGPDSYLRVSGRHAQPDGTLQLARDGGTASRCEQAHRSVRAARRGCSREGESFPIPGGHVTIRVGRPPPPGGHYSPTGQACCPRTTLIVDASAALLPSIPARGIYSPSTTAAK